MVCREFGSALGGMAMPVIRGRLNASKLPDNRRTSLLQRLVGEREGKAAENGPVIFEIPLDQPDKLDVMVVWDEWEGVRSEDRSQLIKDAYQDKADALALALGVTRTEAFDQGLLPYRVRSRFGKEPRCSDEEFAAAALAVGGFPQSDGHIALRFPTQTIAEEAVQQLKQRLPES